MGRRPCVLLVGRESPGGRHVVDAGPSGIVIVTLDGAARAADARVLGENHLVNIVVLLFRLVFFRVLPPLRLVLFFLFINSCIGALRNVCLAPHHALPLFILFIRLFLLLFLFLPRWTLLLVCDLVLVLVRLVLLLLLLILILLLLLVVLLVLFFLPLLGRG